MAILLPILHRTRPKPSSQPKKDEGFVCPRGKPSHPMSAHASHSAPSDASHSHNDDAYMGIRRSDRLPLRLKVAITPTLAVQTSLSLSIVILVEAALSFLGLGTQPPAPSWGSMLSRGRQYMTIAPWLVLAPGLAIMLAVLGFNLLGDGQRDLLDPRRVGAGRRAP